MKPTLTRRFSAGLINLLILGMMESAVFHLLHDRNFPRQLPPLIASLLLWAICLFMKSSPGQSALSLLVLDQEERPISRKVAFLRLLPYGIYLASLALTAVSEATHFLPLLFAAIHLLAMLFVLTNLLSVAFHPQRQSLMDMRLGIQILRFPPQPKLGVN